MTPLFSLRAALAAIARFWGQFFHAPCDARVCAAIRIAYAAIVLVHLSVVYRDAEMLYSDAGVLPLESARQIGSVYAPSIFWYLPSTPTVMETCVIIMAVHAAMLLVGLLSNVNAAALFVWIASLQFRNVVINDGEDIAMRMLGFFLIWMPVGRCWSVDGLVWASWLRRFNVERPGDETGRQGAEIDWVYAAPGWAQRLWQIQMALILLSTALVKLEGEAWPRGESLYYVSRLDDFFGRFWVPAWAFDSPWCVAGLTWTVLLVELLVPLLIWFRETRGLCLVLLVIFHLASDWSMHLFLFHWIMLCGWLAFVTPGDVRWLLSWFGGGRRPLNLAEQSLAIDGRRR
jgi:hypothetical protein